VKFLNNNICVLLIYLPKFCKSSQKLKSAIFLLRYNWPTDLESAPHVSALAMKVSTKFKVDTTIRCLVIALLLLIRYVALWHWPFDFDQWSYMAGHTVNLSTKFEDPTAIRSWVMNSDISERIPLTMCLQPLHMHLSRDLCVGGKFFRHIRNPFYD